MTVVGAEWISRFLQAKVDAVRWLKGNAAIWNGNVSKIGVYAWLSGDHVAELLATRPGDPRYASIPPTGAGNVDARVFFLRQMRA